MVDEELEIRKYVFMYKDKIQENGNGIIYQYVGDDMVSFSKQIGDLYEDIQNIIPDINFSLSFKNDVFEDIDDENYYVEIQYFDEVNQETKNFIEIQLYKNITFETVSK